MRTNPSIAAVSAIVLAFSAPGVRAQSTGLDDLVGARAGQAEGELVRRGYRNTGGTKGDDRSYTNWWNADRNQCVTVATMDGRYASITPTTPPDCGRSATAARRSSRDERGYSDDPRDDRGSHDNRSSEYERRDRGADDRDRDDRPRGYVAAASLSLACRDGAANRFDRRPSEITANAPIQQPNGYVVQGWYDRPTNGTRFFNCRFDADGRLVSIN